MEPRTGFRRTIGGLLLFLIPFNAAVPRLEAQTIEFVGSASAAVNARVPVINDAGDVFYVNGGSFVIGNPATPIRRAFVSVAAMESPGGDTTPYVLSTNGTVTYITSTALVQSNLTQRLTVAAGNAQAAGLGDPLIKYAYDTFSKVHLVFDYGVAPDDTISFRAAVSSNNFFFQTIAVYAGPASNPGLVMDSFHAPPGLPGYTVDNNGYFHALRNGQGLSLFTGRVYNNAIGDNATGIWLHDSVNGVRLVHLVSSYYGTPYPGNPAARLSSVDGGINNWPAMDDQGRYAIVAQGVVPNPPYDTFYGVFAGFENDLRPVATNGLAAPGIAGAYFTNFLGNGPMRMGRNGTLVFLGSIAGAGITQGVNDRVLVVGSNPADLRILAHAGDPAPGMPAGAVWAPFLIDGSGRAENPVDFPINDQLVMFGNNRVAFVGQVTGPGITSSPSASADDSGIWVTADSGSLTLLARRGTPLTTTAGVKPVPGYFALQGGSGLDGKPSGGNRAGQLAFGNGTNTFRATFAQALPPSLNAPNLVGAQLQLTFTTENGKTYTLQWSTNLASIGWGDLQTYVGDGSTRTNTATTTAGTAGFYRLKSQ